MPETPADQEPTIDQYHAHEALDRCHLIACMLDDHLIQHPYVQHDAAAKQLLCAASEALGAAYQILGGKMEWILIAERKPEHGQMVVKCWDSNGNVWAGKHIANAKHESFDKWIPLPSYADSMR